MLLTLGAAVVVLGVLIFVHELGHFLAAKSVGIAVLRFSFGFGPLTPLRFKKGETEYCVSWVPLGGYVKMAGLEDEGGAGSIEGPKEDANVPVERTFDAKPLWARMYVISAGVIMNMLFAVMVYTCLTLIYGVPVDNSTTVGEVQQSDLPLGAATLQEIHPGERLVRINGDTVTGWGDVQKKFLMDAETPMRIEVSGHDRPLLVDVPLSEQENRVKAFSALTPWHEAVAGEVVVGRPAFRAGLQRGDHMVTVNGDSIPSWEWLVRRIEASPGQTLSFVVLRGTEHQAINIVADSVSVAGENGTHRTVGKVGLGPYIPLRHFGPIGSLGQGVRRAGEAGGLVLFTLKGLVLGQVSPRDLGGPILVGQLSGEAARLGADAFFGFMALFSMNLAVLNLLPIPVLDGGHLLFLVIEGVRRKPLSVNQRQKFTQVGFFILVAIMVLALANDVTRVVQKFF